MSLRSELSCGKCVTCQQAEADLLPARPGVCRARSSGLAAHVPGEMRCAWPVAEGCGHRSSVSCNCPVSFLFKETVWVNTPGKSYQTVVTAAASVTWHSHSCLSSLPGTLVQPKCGCSRSLRLPMFSTSFYLSV